MTTLTAKTIQQEPLVLDDLSKYRGSWVAIRDGHVIDSGLDPVELRDRENVKESDVFLLVPSEQASTLFL